ncbi:MAG: hypothetical protein ACJ8GW_08645 [Massilia sp.]
MLLRADFDINQVGADLEYRFTRTDHEGNPLKGKDAGSIYFTTGETFFLQVGGGGKRLLGTAQPFKSFTILDACLITRPQLALYGPGLPTKFSPPSPFVAKHGGGGKNATLHFTESKFKPWIGTQPLSDDYYEQVLAWDDHLVVGDIPGRWDLSFVITVAITWNDNTVTERVFGFDPEGSVGTGMTPP